VLPSFNSEVDNESRVSGAELDHGMKKTVLGAACQIRLQKQFPQLDFLRGIAESLSRVPQLTRKLTSRSGQKYSWTILCQLIALFGSIFTMRIAAHILGTRGFGEYSIARRGMAIVGFTLLLSMNSGLSRYVSLYSSSRSSRSPLAYLLGAVGLGFLTTGFFAAFVFAAPNVVSSILFGQRVSHLVIYAILAAVAGTILQALAEAYYRGHLRMYAANTCTLLCGAVLPIISAASARGSVSRLIFVLGFSIAGVALVFLLGALRSVTWADLRAARPLVAARDLTVFGIPRIGGEFAWFGLFSLPTIIVAHRAGIEIAGYFSFSVSLIQLITTCFTGIGLVLLPHFSKMIACGRNAEMARLINTMLWGCICLAVLAVSVAQLVIGPLIPWFMGAGFESAVPIARWLLAGSVPLVVYILLRQPLDAATVWPHNTVNVSIALAVCIALFTWPVTARFEGPVMCFSFVVLAGLTVRSWRLVSANANMPAILTSELASVETIS